MQSTLWNWWSIMGLSLERALEREPQLSTPGTMSPKSLQEKILSFSLLSGCLLLGAISAAPPSCPSPAKTALRILATSLLYLSLFPHQDMRSSGVLAESSPRMPNSEGGLCRCLMSSTAVGCLQKAASYFRTLISCLSHK